MAPFTLDELGRRPGADVDNSAGSRVEGATKGRGEQPVRHLVIFAAPVVGAAPVRPAAGDRVDHLVTDPIRLEITEVIDSPRATHVRYRVV